jgi:deoxyribodipyrimidine photo-lyase
MGDSVPFTGPRSSRGDFPLPGFAYGNEFWTGSINTTRDQFMPRLKGTETPSAHRKEFLPMPIFNDARVRVLNAFEPDSSRDYVLYWVHGFRRLNRNHALDHALKWCDRLKKPLVIYEGLRIDYPWASARHHRFILEGLLDHVRLTSKQGVNYWPFVETPENPGNGLLRQIAHNACLVVSDDYPAFIIPRQNLALATKLDVAFHVVDGNGLIPLSLLGPAVGAAAHLRPRIHRLFAEAWNHRAVAEPEFPKSARVRIDPPFAPWAVKNERGLAKFLDDLPLDRKVFPVPGVKGGTEAGREVLRHFLADKLSNYATGRNNPDDPAATSASRLSPYLHYGHLSIQEIVEEVLNADGAWSMAMLDPARRNKKDGFFHRDENVNSYLDEAITWRDVGYHWHHVNDFAARVERGAELMRKHRWPHPVFGDLYSALPDWAARSLRSHEKDPRAFAYSLEEWETAATHDPLWNAAQKELVFTGRIHNYLRMLWGKKVLEWSESPELAYLTLEHLNNKYALDGRDPNSYTGILWCFGLFDRPWPPERKVMGNVRYMSSDNTARKFDLDGYYRYVEKLSNHE